MSINYKVKKKKPAAVQAFSDFYEDSQGEFPHKDRVGRVGLEPTWFEPGDFKSPASANSATAPNSTLNCTHPSDRVKVYSKKRD